MRHEGMLLLLRHEGMLLLMRHQGLLLLMRHEGMLLLMRHEGMLLLVFKAPGHVVNVIGEIRILLLVIKETRACY